MNKTKLRIKRLFCGEKDPYFGIKMKQTASEIKGADGVVVAKTTEIIAPDFWSDNAINIMARNYFRKSQVPKKLQKINEENIPEWLAKSTIDSSLDASDLNNYTQEKEVTKVIDRMVGAWSYWGVKGQYFETNEDAQNFFDEVRYMLVHQMAAPNSPQWFNTGLNWAYGINGDAQGHYFYNEQTKQIELSNSAYERPQPHACFIQSVSDDLVCEGGIMDLWRKEALLFKYGSGTGTNFSNIRGKGEKLSGGGYSSGLMSFLKIGDVAGSSIKSGGTTRRAAKMVIVDIDHPEIEDFIKWKSSEEEKVLDFVIGSKVLKKHFNLIKEAYEQKAHLKASVECALEEGIPTAWISKILYMLQNGIEVNLPEYSLNWDSEIYGNIFGKSSNNSVRISDDFLKKVEKDEDFELINRTNGKACKTVKARYLWQEIGMSAWACADPGVQFDTTINEWHTCANSGRINASNPCSEYMFLDDTACNLASLNLIHFVDDFGNFFVEKFRHAVFLWTVVLEISVYMAQFPSKEIALRSFQFRTLGLGFGNLGSFLMRLGIAYDSEKARNTAAAITSLMQATAYEASARMAQFLGPFEKFAENKECMLKVIENHAAASDIGDYKHLSIHPARLNAQQCIFREIVEVLAPIWKKVIKEGAEFGFRNAQVSVIAPTGTIGFVMDFSTTGVEPQFAQVTMKQLAGGGMFKLVNEDISIALKNLNYSQSEIEEIRKYVIGHGCLDEKLTKFLINNGVDVTELAKINSAISKSFHISQAFLGLEKEFYQKLGVKDSGNVLNDLGYSFIEEANSYSCGHMTIEGAPYLRPEHLNIFDCASPSGDGIRCLSSESHIKMMAAIQPFISGAISKTIHLPKEATVNDCLEAYMLSWHLGLKAVALYRDGSKYSSVLQTKKAGNELDMYFEKEEKSNLFDGKGYTKHVLINGMHLWYSISEDNSNKPGNVIINFGKEGSTLRGWASAWAKILSLYLQAKGDVALVRAYKAFKHSKFEPMGRIQGNNSIDYASSIPDYIVEELILMYPDALNSSIPEAALPPKRDGKINKIKIGQETLYIIIGENNYGIPCEIFVAGMGNEGSDLRGWMNCCAKLISLYFQDCQEYAVNEFIKTFEGSKFEPSGFVKGHDEIKSATSALDFLAKHLKVTYASKFSGEQIELIASSKKIDNVEVKFNMSVGYKVDEPCSSCKSFRLRYNGTCYICDNCFTTTGCS